MKFMRKKSSSAVQQSHHCGIETLLVFTLVGAKRMQQSHHCGIETSGTVKKNWAAHFAAIAPLWD
jgi:hypothetical protein